METSGITVHREPWNKGKIVGQKAPFKVKDIWALHVRQVARGRNNGHSENQAHHLTEPFRDLRLHSERYCNFKPPGCGSDGHDKWASIIKKSWLLSQLKAY